MIFWNMAGLTNKDGDFWKYLKDFNVISLTETLLKERGEEKLRDKLPQDYKQFCQAAVRDKFKGRGMGGMIVGIRREIREKKIEQKKRRHDRYKIQNRRRKMENNISIQKKNGNKCMLEKCMLGRNNRQRRRKTDNRRRLQRKNWHTR